MTVPIGVIIFPDGERWYCIGSDGSGGIHAAIYPDYESAVEAWSAGADLQPIDTSRVPDEETVEIIENLALEADPERRFRFCSRASRLAGTITGPLSQEEAWAATNDELFGWIDET